MAAAHFIGEYPEGKRLSKIISAVAQVVDSANLIFTRRAVGISRLNSESVLMVDLCLPAKMWTSYELKIGRKREHKVGVNIKQFQQILSLCTNHPVTLICTGQQVKLKQEDAGIYTQRLVTIDRCEVNEDYEASPPELSFLATVSMKASLFAHLIKAHYSVHDTVSISIEEDKVVFSLDSAKDVNLEVVLLKPQTVDGPESKKLSIETKSKEPIRQLFSCAMMKLFAITDLSDMAQLSMRGEEEAICVNFDLGEDAHLRYYLAPKVSEANV